MLICIHYRSFLFRSLNNCRDPRKEISQHLSNVLLESRDFPNVYNLLYESKNCQLPAIANSVFISEDYQALTKLSGTKQELVQN